ncbi:MAG: hypothetical protein R3Y28_07255 [Candidatus Gastranaerophilales bacterium]
MNQYNYCFWPGAYSFKNEVSMFIKYIKEQIKDIMERMEKVEDQTAQ